ncbi:hypothetical protein FMUND_13588 [Fusarium mundagurra]|uniref:Uncharacterized protein n=1 Tax=Fusarium mundagurra TaxID=1567541 RepID=A0A8H5XZ00_9HYPO|nr:hypothetical protein FMUND_13588 [Fusarium mundagurra]
MRKIILQPSHPQPHDEDQWRQKRAELGLNDAQGILRALDDILSPRRHSGVRTLATLQIPLNVPDHLAYRAVEAGTAGSDAQRAVALSMFGGLVFMGECCVALKMGVSTEHVEDSMRQFLTCLRSSNCTAGSRTFTMYRHVAVWVTQQNVPAVRRFSPPRLRNVSLWYVDHNAQLWFDAYQLLRTDNDLGLRCPGKIRPRGRISKRDS